jgi:hypothetical protein
MIVRSKNQEKAYARVKFQRTAAGANNLIRIPCAKCDVLRFSEHFRWLKYQVA